MSAAASGSTPRRIVLVRHAQTVDNAARVWQGHRDSALSEVGESQVAAMAAAVTAAYHPSLVFSSDLQRAARTAAPIAAAAEVELELDDRLREVDVGEWQGMSAEAVRTQYPDLLAAIERGEDLAKGVTGETLVQVHERVGAAASGIADRIAPGETAVVVAHGVSARAFAAELVGIPARVAEASFRSLDNCHWIDLVEGPRGWRIAAWNLGASTIAGGATAQSTRVFD